MVDLPSGTVTLLFSDIEGSTRLLQRLGDQYAEVLNQHRTLLRSAFVKWHGVELGTEGDSFCVAFPRALDAVLAAIEGQRALAAHAWPEGVAVRVRMGLHTGEPQIGPEGYVGLDVHRAARVSAAAHGGQVLISETTRTLVASELPQGVGLCDLGKHWLKDLVHPEALYQIIIPGLTSEFPPPRSLNYALNNLPVELTAFIGREQELKQVDELLRGTRLLTLVGAGGCGKTRLALQAAERGIQLFPDGVWLVELAPLADSKLVAQAIATALGLYVDGSVTLAVLLARYLHDKTLLLILDNCEHLIEACAQITDSLLRSSPGLHILATSREALGIAGETALRVPSLSLPPVENGADEGCGPDALTQFDATRLFCDRAAAALPSFVVTSQNAPIVAQICRRLDGIPLAIELAAARVRTLSVEQIGARLDNRFRLLTGGSRTALPRQQTLRATIDWSYALLTEPERVLLRRLSVFVGGWTLEAAEYLCGCEAENVLDLLDQLVAKSLVLAEERQGNIRYRLLETVRQYARDRLMETDEAEILRERHRDWFLQLAEDAGRHLRQAEQLESFSRLETEHENLRAALAWSLGEADGSGVDKAGRLAVSMIFFWSMRGYSREGSMWLEKVLAHCPPGRVRAGVLWGRVGLGSYNTNQMELEHLAEESFREYRSCGDKSGAVHAASLVIYLTRDPIKEQAIFDEANTLAQELGDDWLIGLILIRRGMKEHQRCKVESARILYERAEVHAKRTGSRWLMAGLLVSLGELVRGEGDLARSRECYERALVLHKELGNHDGVEVCQENLGRVALSEGNLERATELLTATVRLSLKFGNRSHMLGGVAALASVAALQGQPIHAARLFGAFEFHSAQLGFWSTVPDQAEFDRGVQATRDQLSPAEFESACAEGRAMVVEQAAKYALEHVGGASGR